VNPGTDWLDQARRLVDAVKSSLADDATDSTAHGSDCRWCPLCQAAAVLRGERPEVTAALDDLLASAAAALRTFAAGGAPTEPRPAEDEDGDPPPAAQHFEIA